MTERSDIPNRLIYTCNCGWIDRGHAFESTTRPFVGADQLWSNILWERGPRTIFNSEAVHCTNSGLFSFSCSLVDPQDAYGLVYRQDMGASLKVTTVYVGSEAAYVVRTGLTRAQKISVALAIFQEITVRFEKLQGSLPWSLRTGPSSFSEEDLVSNLLGFYTAVTGIDYMTEAYCRPVSPQASFDVWDATGGVTAHKNHTFEPIFHECDECKRQPKFPDALRKYVPAQKGSWFRDWTGFDNRMHSALARGKFKTR